MALFSIKKRYTNLFDDEARARLVGAGSYASSGSDHSGGDSPCLSELVHDFLEDNIVNECDSIGIDFDNSERVDSVYEVIDSVEELLNLSSLNTVDPYRSVVNSHVSEALEKFAFLREIKNVSVFLRNVMSFLREKGHNAAICKTRWDSSGEVTAGNYEFIDVVKSDSSTWQRRYFVDIDFAGQFEIARPTRNYSEVVSYVPGVFIGTEEELKRTVSIICGVAKKCFKCRGLSLPPWRKEQYMKKKWFAPYRRTTNPVHVNPVHGNPVPCVVSNLSVAKCRMVGFDDVVSEARHNSVFIRTR
ncbi:hypothetical protein Lal_00011189 [Lupinus albus]|uniref:Uncharacterized protein n=1 Tax=Lupinus albus TaxID=3870 RepID=A0A6A5NS19_LUPAL|nr:hypothetical protein Lalb_Chr13g0291051 [Lupinus albus]KAF1888419.1 hypothetical protein Lal_00011189 [Lupinus albus]